MRRYVACSLAFEFDGSNAVFRLLNVVLLKSFLVLFLICASGAYAFARENTAVKATQTDKYIRLFFYCKQPVKFNASLKANKLQISFGRDVEINPSSIESVGAEISNVSFSHESNTATITLASNSYGMRKFIGEDFVGIDIKGARFWRGAKTAVEEQMHNVAFIRTQIELINHIFSDGEVDEIWITFPDPQIKYKRTKHRMTNSDFLQLYKKILKPEGVVNLKTDSEFMHGYTLGLLHGEGHEVLYANHNVYKNEGAPSEVTSIQTFYENYTAK